MKPSEYGGSDTVKTSGIQPAPHVLQPAEKLRLIYGTDENDVITPVPVGLDPTAFQ